MREITLKDIAQKVGCSANTVSLALKDSPRISLELRQQIEKVSQEMNYVPNNLARSLVLGKTGTIGLILRNISSTILVTQARKIERYLTKLGYTLSIVTSQDSPELENKAISMMLSNKVDGLLLNTIFKDNIPRIEQLRSSGFPVVLMSGFFSQKVNVDAVYTDHVAGPYLSTKHLLDLGHKRIAFVRTGEEDELMELDELRDKNSKFVGFEKALAYAGITAEKSHILTIPYSFREEKSFMNRLLDQMRQYDAFFIEEDETAIPLMKQLMEHQIRIPEDIAISSMDNIKYAESAVVALTSVGYDTDYITQKSVDLLLDISDGRRVPGMFVDIPVQPTLFIRDSCGGKKAGQ